MPALTLPSTALITPAELDRDALASLSLDVSEAPPGTPNVEGDWNAVVAAIIDVTGLIEASLSRRLMSQSVNQGVDVCDFVPYSGGSGQVAVWARQWPVVEVFTPGYSISWDRTQILTSGAEAGSLAYTAGYRREDQSSITPPPLIPGDIRGVCTELVLHRLFSAENKQFGTGRRMQQIGSGQMATVESVDRDFVERTLARIHRHAYTVL